MSLWCIKIMEGMQHRTTVVLKGIVRVWSQAKTTGGSLEIYSYAAEREV